MPHTKQKLCNISKSYIQSICPTRIYKPFQRSISSSIQLFIKHHQIKLLNAIHLHTNPAPITQYCSHLLLNKPQSRKQILLRDIDETPYSLVKYDDNESAKYKIPPFLEIFKFLLNHSSITKNLTPEEKQITSRILSLSNPHEIYQLLHNNTVGNTLARLYSNYGRQIDLTKHFPTMDFHNLLINSFTSYTILEEIEKKMNTVSICTIETNTGIKYPNFLYLFHSFNSKRNKKDILDIITIIKNISDRVIFLNRFLRQDRLPNRLIIFLTDAKKEIDSQLEMAAHFRTININTAVTNMQDIIIYRKEELYRALFHELIHFHDLDYKILSEDEKKNIARIPSKYS